MSNLMIGLLVALSAAVWVYSKVARRTGGNTRSSLIVAGIAAAGAFLVVQSLLAILDNYLG